MVERRDDLDLVYECPAGRYMYVYPTDLVTGRAKASCYKPACRKEKKNLKSPRRPSYPVVCGGESQGRDLSRFFFPPGLLSLSLSKSCTQGTPYLTLPYLTLPYLTLPYLTLLMLPTETRNIPKKPLYPNSKSTRSRSRSLGGAEPFPRFLPSTWVRFSKKIRCTILSTYL